MGGGNAPDFDPTLTRTVSNAYHEGGDHHTGRGNGEFVSEQYRDKIVPEEQYYDRGPVHDRNYDYNHHEPRNNHENRDYYNSRTEMNVDRNYVPEMDSYRLPEEERRHFDRNSRPEMGYDRPAEEERGGHRNWRRHEERQFHQDETLYREYSNEFEQQNRYQDSHRFHEGNNRNFDQQYQRNYENTNAEVC